MKEYRLGRNFIRVGDVVKVTPSSPGKHDGFEARVLAIYDQDGEIVFQLLGGTRGRLHTRFIRAERIRRVAQVRGGERRERKRS